MALINSQKAFDLSFVQYAAKHIGSVGRQLSYNAKQK